MRARRVNCLKCPEVTFGSDGLGAVLCVQHLLEVLKWKKAWTCAVPSCDRRLFLRPNRECAWCALGRPVTVNMTTEILPVKILRGADYLATRDAVCKDVTDDDPEKMEDDLEDP